MSGRKADCRSAFSAITVRSPMCAGDEAKDQDRVSWFAPTATAAACDGLTSSPYSAEGAETVAQWSPVIFHGHGSLRERLEVIADRLVLLRLEAKHNGVRPHPGASPGLQALLREVAQQNLTRSFQTTLVAAAFVLVDEEVEARVLSIGDSAFFAFSNTGDLLATSLAPRQSAQGTGTEAPGCPAPGASNTGLRFGPGDELLVKVLCDAAERPRLAEQMDIRPGSAGRWLVCIHLDLCRRSDTMEEDTDAAAASLHLGPEDVLVVPKYLVEMPLDPSLAAYRRVRFSKTIRSTASARPVKLDLQDKSHLTAVLPDHVYAGNWTHFRERFPRDAQFVLCTDGFYSAFAEPQELWEWLTEHGTRLEAEETKEGVMAELHHRLRERQGDDDISFVWVAARQTGETEPLDPMMSPDGGEDHAC